MNWDYLVALDTGSIHEYIFGTNKLREIRGASILLDKLNISTPKDELKKYGQKDTDYKCILAGGGNIKVLFSDKTKAAEYEDDLKRLFKEKAGVRFTTILSERKGEDEKQWIIRAERELQRAKDMHKERCQIISSGFFKACQACGLYPAEKEDVHVGERRYICKSCHQKIKESDKKNYTQTEIYKRLFEKIGFKPELPSDFNEIGMESKPDGYIGFIYADGNRMGEHLANFATFDDLKKFSTDVDEATLEATTTALINNFKKECLFSWDNIPGNDNERLIGFLKRKYSLDWIQSAKIEKIDDNKTIRVFAGKNHLSLTLNNEKTEINLKIDGGRTDELAVKIENNKLNIYDKYFPFQIILAGGDDLIIALPANKAVNVAVDFCKNFGKRLESRDITTSASIVICHDSLPIKNILNAAESLIRNAKAESRKNRGGSYLEFIVVTGSSLEDPVDKRKRELEYCNYFGFHSITKRPYSLIEIGNLINAIHELKKAEFPNNKLNALYTSLFKGHNQSILDALYIKTRLQKEPRAALDKIFQFRLEFFPWEEMDINKFTTPIGDIYELYEFV